MSKRTRRKGSVAVELLLLSPIVLGLVLAVIEIGMMTAANEHLAAASCEGRRVAALGGDVHEVQLLPSPTFCLGGAPEHRPLSYAYDASLSRFFLRPRSSSSRPGGQGWVEDQ
jgi:hypothetical protein